jgi:predicted dehydrogenase
MVASAQVDAVRIETPKCMHCEHALAAARLIIGHFKVIEPVRAIAAVVRSGRLGGVARDRWPLVQHLAAPRLAEELDKKRGVGFVLRQAPHLVDLAMLIAGAPAVSVHAMAREWQGVTAICATLIRIQDRTAADINLGAMGYFPTSELTRGIGIFDAMELWAKPASRSGALAPKEKYASPRERKAAPFRPFVGLTVASWGQAAMRELGEAIYLYTD